VKILITGTHFTPALATIEELKKYRVTQIVYVGRKTTKEGDSSRSIESRIIPEYGVKFRPIIAGRFQRYFSIYTILSLLKLPIGFIQSFFILLKEKPDVVLSFGGYISVPVVFWGWMFSVPIIVHEQTLVTGLATKISLIFADKIAISFPESKLSKNPKSILTGNPIRQEILDNSLGVNLPHPRGVVNRHLRIPTVLITGGNQGSHVINLAVEECLGELLKIANLIHQTGDSKYKDFERLINLENKKYKVYKWIDDIGDIIKGADLIVSRAGIVTLSELAYLGKPALVVPIPYLYKNEQEKNARYFEKIGLVKILSQTKLNGENLLKSVKSCLDNLEVLNKNAQKAKQVIIPDGSKRLALETILLSK